MYNKVDVKVIYCPFNSAVQSRPEVLLFMWVSVNTMYFLHLFIIIWPQNCSSISSVMERSWGAVEKRGGGGRREGSIAPCVTRFPANQWLSCLISDIRTLRRPSNPGRADVMLRWVKGRGECTCVRACVYLCVVLFVCVSVLFHVVCYSVFSQV